MIFRIHVPAFVRFGLMVLAAGFALHASGETAPRVREAYDPFVGLTSYADTLTPGAYTYLDCSVSDYRYYLYRWQSKAPGAAEWTNATDGPVFSGSTWHQVKLTVPSLAWNGTKLRCVVSGNGLEPIASPEFTLTVVPAVAPQITKSPASAEIRVGEQLYIYAEASGTPSPLFQWYRDGALLPNQNQTWMALTSVKESDAGHYYAIASNSAGTATTAEATVTVLPALKPDFGDQTIGPLYYSLGDSLTLGFSLASTIPLTYQWYKDGQPIAGATNPGYWIQNGTVADAGTYALLASNANGLAMSPDVVVRARRPATDALPWISSGQVGDVVYFLAAKPGRIHRYDLVQKAWLPVVYLPEVKVPIGFQPTPEGVFIAYDAELAVRPLSLEGETTVFTSSAALRKIFSAGDWVYIIQAASVSRSFRRATLEAGPVGTLGADSDFTYSPATGKVYGGHDYRGIWLQYALQSDGTLVGETLYNSEIREFPMGTRLALPADESALFDNSGVIYSNPGRSYLGSVGAAFDDVAFPSGAPPVVLRERTLEMRGGTGWSPSARFDLAQRSWSMVARGSSLVVFSAPLAALGNPEVAEVTLASFTALASPANKPAPEGRPFSLEDGFVDAHGVVTLLSRSESGLVRWDPVTETFLPTLGLRGRPAFFSYAPAIGRALFGYGDLALSDVFPAGDEPREEVMGSLPAPGTLFGLAAMDELTAVSYWPSSNGFNVRIVLDEMGQVRHLSTESYWPRLFSWNSSNRAVLAYNYDYSITNTPFYVYSVSEAGDIATTNVGYVTGLIHPLRWRGDGVLGLTGNQIIVNADLQLVYTLPNPVADGAWLADGFYTIRSRPTGTEVQKWAPLTFELAGTVIVPGRAERIFRRNDTSLVVVTSIDGCVAFTNMDHGLVAGHTVYNNAVPPRPEFFSATGYLARNPDVAATLGQGAERLDRAWWHYYQFGLGEGRTDGDFNVQAYLAQYPDLAAQFGTDLKAAALHWYTTGRANGERVPQGFDVNGYFARNSDIAGLFTNDRYGAWLHYYNYGLFEGRSFDANFIPAEYLELNQDLKTVFGSNLQAAVMHWFNYGHPIEDRMGRVPIGFNVDSYLARYPDLAAVFAGITPTAVRNVTVWHHYLAYGTLEGRSDGDFEAYHYLATNPDLAGIFGSDIQAAALHWYFYGRREGRRIPGGFTVQNYRSLYPDVVLVFGDDLYGSWIHYRDNGVFEGRIYDNLFRPADYLSLNPDVAAAIGTNYRDALLHWLYYGQYEGRPGRD